MSNYGKKRSKKHAQSLQNPEMAAALSGIHGRMHGERVVIITDAGEGTRFGLVVDELLGHQQVVIKSIEESYGSVPGIAAATILGNGRVAFILDVEKLSEMAVNSPAGNAMSSNSTPTKAASPALT